MKGKIKESRFSFVIFSVSFFFFGFENEVNTRIRKNSTRNGKVFANAELYPS